MGIGRAPGKVGLLGCSGVVLCTTIVTMRGRTQDTNSEVAPYRCGARPDSPQAAVFRPSHCYNLDFLWSGRRDSNPRPSPWQ